MLGVHGKSQYVASCMCVAALAPVFVRFVPLPLLLLLMVQAGETLSVSVSLKPSTDVLSRLAKYLLPASGDAGGEIAEEGAVQVGCRGQRGQPSTTASAAQIGPVSFSGCCDTRGP